MACLGERPFHGLYRKGDVVCHGVVVQVVVCGGVCSMSTVGDCVVDGLVIVVLGSVVIGFQG